MKALYFDEKLSLRDTPKPECPPGEALVRVTTAGICKTDVEICAGYMGFSGVIGHEFVGTVESCSDPGLIGKRVVGEINVGCGTCEFCRQGLQRHCAYRSVLGIAGRNGAMAEYLSLPMQNLLRVPDNVSDEIAVFTEPLAAALEIIEQSHIQPAHEILVIGDGKLGLLACMVLRLIGSKITLAGKHPEKNHIVADRVDSILRPEQLEDTRRFDVVVEASGNPTGFYAAVKHVKPRGTIVLKSTYHQEMNFNPAPLVINEITLIGSRCGQFEPALRLLVQGLVDPSPLITAVYEFEQAEAAFQRAKEKDALKVLLRWK